MKMIQKTHDYYVAFCGKEVMEIHFMRTYYVPKTIIGQRLELSVNLLIAHVHTIYFPFSASNTYIYLCVY